MNDAYTIGITLALENGVSAGVEEIRRDLEELNRTVDASIGELVRLDSQLGATLRVLHQVAQDSGLTQIAAAGQRLATRVSAIKVPPAPSQQLESELPAPTTSSVASSIPTAREEATAFPSALARDQPVPLIVHSIAVQPAVSPPAVPAAQMAPPRIMISVNAPSPSNTETASAGYSPSLPIAAPAELPSTSDSAKATSVAPFSSTVVPGGPAQTLQPSDLAALVRRLAPVSVEIPSGDRSTRSLRGETRLGSFDGSAVPVQRRAAARQIGRSSMKQTYGSPLIAAPFPALVTTDSQHDLRGEATIAIADSTKGPAAPTTMSGPGIGVPMAPLLAANSSAKTLSYQNDAAEPETGHIFLDGQLVGRWMREHLAQMAARPPSGSTGFDPKLGMVWPGAPIQA